MKKSHISIFWSLFFILNIFTAKAVDPYLDPTLTVDARAKDLVSRMTLAEKITQLGHKSSAISRLSVKSYNYWVEGLHGVARQGLATSFPQPYGLAATWDTAHIFNVATAISDEARVKNNTSGIGLTYWCPVVNMARDPRWGREEENFGEDTYLASRLAVNYIKGMQGNHPKYMKTIATAKHFALNNVEQGRTSTSSNVDERSFREYFLPVFKACVQEGKAYSIMSSYNAVNGVPSPVNRLLLTNILRKEWGFNGFVVSDCDAVSDVALNHKYVSSLTEATALSLRNGDDLNCGSTFPTFANDAITKGLITVAQIDTALVRVFKARFLLGEFDPTGSVPYTSIPANKLDSKEHRDLALLSAQKSIVLLKNKNSFLPLRKDTLKSIAVIGPHAKACVLGDYSGSPLVSVTPFQGIAAKLGINVSDGTIEAETAIILSGGPKSEACGEGGSEIGYIKNNTYIGYDSISFPEGVDKVNFRVASESAGGTIQMMIDNPTTGTVVGSATVVGTGGWQTWTTITANVSGLSGKHKLYLKFTGATSGYLFNINWFKFYNSVSNSANPVSFTNGNQTINYAFGTSINGALSQADIDEAVVTARKSQLVVLVCGTDQDTGREGKDRADIVLPGAQQQLIQAVYQANPQTILVLVTGFSLSVVYAQDNLPAIMSAWFAGQAQGTAIADVIFGDYNPGGKLASTWYKSLSDIPSKYNYDVKNNRTYMYYKGTPLYPFGYGLSYTTFNYSNINVSSPTLGLGNSVEVSADVTNSGSKVGDEVAQLYINISSTLVRPIKQLKGFSRVTLQPGETKTVKFKLSYEDLQYYNETTRNFEVEGGPVNIYVGSSSQDIRLTSSVNATAGTVSSTYRQNPYTVTQAENYENKTATVAIKSCSEGGLCIDSLVNNSNVVFKNMNFDLGALSFKANYSSLLSSGKISIVLDNVSGTVVGTLNIKSTGSVTTFTTDSCNLNAITGIHDVYLVFSGNTSVCRLNWFSFGQDAVPNALNNVNENNSIKLKIYPNPTNKEFFVSYSLPETSDVKVDIFTMDGMLCSSNLYKNQFGSNNQKINILEKYIKSGVYIVKFTTNKYIKSEVLNILNK